MKGDATEQTLLFGVPHSQHIPIVDNQLKKLAGHPTPMQAAATNRIVKMTRNIVNTRAFEYLVGGLMNPKSSLRSSRLVKKPAIVRIL